MDATPTSPSPKRWIEAKPTPPRVRRVCSVGRLLLVGDAGCSRSWVAPHPHPTLKPWVEFPRYLGRVLKRRLFDVAYPQWNGRVVRGERGLGSRTLGCRV